MYNKIKVLVVDDSMVFREVISRGISSDPMIEVVARAIDPLDAIEKIREFRPDVMVCDVEMPKMNGITFIKNLLPQYNLPVIIVSSLSDVVFDAIDAGAIDFVSKPNIQSPGSVEKFIVEMISKIKIAVNAKVARKTMINNPTTMSHHVKTNNLIAIGASTGGTEALFNVLKYLPSSIPGIVIVQHIPAKFSRMFAERLNNQTNLKVKEAQHGDFVERGHVYIAPGEFHMSVKRISDQYKLEVFQGDKINGHCPSVDVLFESVAKEAGSNSIGIILTGMGYDGAKGLLSMRRKGARTIGQDEQSSVVYGMPKVAYELGAVEKKVSLSDIPGVLLAMLN